MQIKNNKNFKSKFHEREWICLISLTPTRCKYVFYLFYKYSYFKSYTDYVLTTGQYVFSRNDNCNNTTYDRMYDELLINGKVVAVIMKERRRT